MSHCSVSNACGSRQASLYDMTRESWFHGRANRWKVATHTQADNQPAEKPFSANPVSLRPGAALISFFFTLDLFRGVLGFVQLKFWICSGAVLDLLDRGF